MKRTLNRKKSLGVSLTALTLAGWGKNERLEERIFLARLRNGFTPYILSLSILAGICAGCSKDRVTSGDNLESRTKIVFASYRDGNHEIYVMNADGSNQTNLTNNPASDDYPSWSPDGKKIAFGSTRDSHSEVYNAEVYIMNADGSNQTNLTNNPAFDAFPSWSPDGKKIAFASERDGDGNMNVYIMNTDGSNQTRLTNNPAHDVKPIWSPDGKKIAFQTTRTGKEEVYVMNSDGSSQTRLTDNPAWDGCLSWSPDGKKIAFYSLRKDVPDEKEYGADGRWWYECNAEIYVMNADGSEQKNITNNPAYDGYPSWSPFLKTEK